MKNFIFSLIVLVFFIEGCMQQVTLKKDVVCPKPQIICSPTKWQGLPYDSSLEVNKFLDSYYTFKKVRQINNIGDDWSLSFFSKNKALMCFNDENIQKTMIVRMVKYDKGRLLSGIGVPLDGHIGSASFYGNQVYFSYSPTDNMIGRSDIYQGYFKNKMISNPNPVEGKVHQNKFTWESQPSLSANGLVMFFASDRKLGYGATDIWFSIKLRNNSWSEPINCGEMINTQCPELTPFIDKSGKKLLFASAGHDNVGGYDIFSSDISDKFWEAVRNDAYYTLAHNKDFFSKAKNLRPPLNTKYDELYPSSPSTIDTLLYYSSNQDAENASLISMEGGFDIFVRRKVVNEKEKKSKSGKLAEGFAPDLNVDIPMNEPKIEIAQTFKLEGKVYNKSTMEELPQADITVKKMPENKVVKKMKTDSEGKYSVKLKKDVDYQLTASAKKLFFVSQSVLVESFDTVKVKKLDLLVPEMLTLRINFPTDNFDQPYKFVLDSNGIETITAWQSQLDELADNIKASINNLSKILIIGHTDKVGSTAYNKTLGRKRADFVVAQLIIRGVPKEILESKSMGESEPLAKREGENKKMFYKRLRRVELTKIWQK